MQLVRSDSLTDHLTSIVHQDTQEHDEHFDLTVAEVHQFTEAGSLDFGGSEFQPAEKRSIDTKKKNEDDDYGWWHLRKGTYQVTMNEQLTNMEGGIALVAPHEHVQESGILANTNIISTEQEDTPITMTIQVPEAGCNIKENARFAALYILAK